MTLQYKKELLIRKNRCKDIHGTYLSKIKDFLLLNEESDINFISLEESDAIRGKEYNKVSSVFKYKIIDRNIFKLIIDILKKNNDSYYIFIDHDWECCGCFFVKNLNSINDNFCFGNKVTDDIVLINKSFSLKIHLDYYEINDEYYLDCEIYRVQIPMQITQ